MMFILYFGIAYIVVEAFLDYAKRWKEEEERKGREDRGEDIEEDNQ